MLCVGMAAVAGGIVNALAGGGTLITFPVLTAVGIPMVSANITNTVALCPGYLGATFAQKKDLTGQGRRMWLMIPASVVGGILGGILLVCTTEKAFSAIVPYLILLAVVLLALQDKVRAFLLRNPGQEGGTKALNMIWPVLAIIPTSVYGGYFGAGLSVIVIAVLGIFLEDTLTRLNALKQAIAFAVNIAACCFFLFSGHVVWSAAVVMAAGSLAGGVIGGRLAGRIKPRVLKAIVLIIGSVVAVIYFVR